MRYFKRNTYLRQPPSDSEPPTRDVYIAFTPQDGIPALAGDVPGTGTGTSGWGDVPGSAYCYIYKVDPGTRALVGVHLRQLVLNLNRVAVPGDTWVTIKQEKFSVWLVDAPYAGGGGTLTIKGLTTLTTYTGINTLGVNDAVVGSTGPYIVLTVTGTEADIGARIADINDGGVLNNGSSLQTILGDKQFNDGASQVITVYPSQKAIVFGPNPTGNGDLWVFQAVEDVSSNNPQTFYLGYSDGATAATGGWSWTITPGVGSGESVFDTSSTGGSRFSVNGNPGGDFTVVLAKLTGGGTDGSITVIGGIVTAYTPPT